MFSARAAWIASLRREFISGSGCPDLAETVISRASLANIFALTASWRPLRCMMFLNWECPAMVVSSIVLSVVMQAAVSRLTLAQNPYRDSLAPRWRAGPAWPPSARRRLGSFQVLDLVTAEPFAGRV